MVKAGDKLVMTVDRVIQSKSDTFYHIEGFRTLMFDQYGIDKLRSFEKAVKAAREDAYRSGYEAGHEAGYNFGYDLGLKDGYDRCKADADLIAAQECLRSGDDKSDALNKIADAIRSGYKLTKE